MGFVSELKRRNVFRVAAAYALVAWLLVQIGEAVFPAFGVPDAIFRGLVIFLALGFPLVLLFAWAYELTPEGLKRDRDVDPVRSIARHTGRKLDFAIIGLLVAAVAYLLVDKFLIQPEPVPESLTESVVAPELTGFERSVAALPFANHGSDPDSQAFASGIHDDLLTQLTRIPNMRVISRTSVREYADSAKNMRQIGEELSVKHILEGGVQKAGDRIRINVQLIDAQTDAHLWAETYDRELTTANIFAIQSEIAGNISRALQVVLSSQTTDAISKLPTGNLAAYGDYLAALAILEDDGRNWLREERLAAIDLLGSAVQQDPEFTLAWVRMADAHMSNVRYSGDRDELEKVRDALDRARQVDPRLPEIHLVTAELLYLDRHYEEALAELEIVKAGLPGDGKAIELSFYIYRGMGKEEEALDALERALLLNPRDVELLWAYGEELQGKRRYKEAREFLGKAVTDLPTKWRLRMALASVDFYQYGDVPATLRVWQRPDAPRDTYFYEFMLAASLLEAGDLEGALEHGLKAAEAVAGGNPYFFMLPDELRAWIFRELGRDEESKSYASKARERTLTILQDESQDPSFEPLRLIAMGRIAFLLGNKKDVVNFAQRSLKAIEREKGNVVRGVDTEWRVAYADLLCLVDLTGAEAEYRRVLSRENSYTLLSVVGRECKKVITGTEHYQRLEKEFDDLTEGVVGE